MSSSRLEKQVEKLEAELKEKKAQVSREKRKERGGQLVALGIMVEVAFKGLTPEGQAKLRAWAEPLDVHNKQRVLAAFERLGLEEKAPESVAQMQQPESLTRESAAGVAAGIGSGRMRVCRPRPRSHANPFRLQPLKSVAQAHSR